MSSSLPDQFSARAKVVKNAAVAAMVSSRRIFLYLLDLNNMLQVLPRSRAIRRLQRAQFTPLPGGCTTCVINWLLLVNGVDTKSVNVRGARRLAAEEIGQLTVVGAIVDDEIGKLTALQRADFGAAAQTVGSVDGGRGDSLGRRHFHLRAG